MWRRRFGKLVVEAAWFPLWAPGHRMFGVGVGTPTAFVWRFEVAIWWGGIAVNFSK